MIERYGFLGDDFRVILLLAVASGSLPHCQSLCRIGHQRDDLSGKIVWVLGLAVQAMNPVIEHLSGTANSSTDQGAADG